MSCWDEYEHLQYSGNLTNFNGSLYELQQAILAKDQGCPFEEMFYSFEKSGKSHLIVRRTPFNPEDWLTTPTVYIDSDPTVDELILLILLNSRELRLIVSLTAEILA